jgi:alpha-beta hydrolase superfamily lysophospholipase
MSADPYIEKEGGPTTGLAEALYFDSGENRLFGWIHRPTGVESARVGLVICKPFGYEAVCSHRSVRVFAETAAGLGIPTLRFDYAGTGDSCDIDPEADQLAIWVEDVLAAIAELRRLSGVERVCLLGFRLGALLATLAAARCKAVTGLALIGPIVSGKRYLRELRTSRLAAAAGEEGSSPNARVPQDGAGSMEVGGFVFSAATLEALGQIDLQTLEASPCTDVLVIDGAKLPGSRAWVAELSRLGARATGVALPGLVEMLMTAPQFSSIPRAMIGAVSEWLVQIQHAGAAPIRMATRAVESTPVPMLRTMTLPAGSVPPGSVPPGGTAHSAPVTERPLFLPSQALLFGILAEPGQQEARRRGVILVNAGADYHIGASGIYVALARRWARRGYFVLRMDLAGLGDSATRPGLPDNEVFPPAALDDIRTAIDWMRTRHGVTDIALGGVCSGAYHALRAAVSELPVNRVMMVNPETFFWEDGRSIHDMQVAALVREPKIYREKLISVRAWKKLLSGHVDVLYVTKLLLRRMLLALEITFRDSARRLNIRLPHDLGFELEEVGKRGVRLVFVFARGEPGIELLKLQSGRALQRLGERCRVHIVDGADHVFSSRESKRRLEDILSDELFAPVDWAASSRDKLKDISAA